MTIAFALAITAARALAQEAHGPQPFTVKHVGPKNIGFGNVELKVAGSGFINGATVILGKTDLPTHFQNEKKLSATASLMPIPGNTYAVTVRNGDGKVLGPFPLVVGLKKSKIPYAAAFRFLEQATWGPDVADVIALQQSGFSTWLSNQQSVAPSIIQPPPAMSNIAYAQAQFMNNAINAPDQLRQRVAFALAQIFVISGLKIPVEGMVPYLNLLSQNAFGNYKDVMKAVTLSPSMGHYLDMVNNDKPNPSKGTLPNENYAREFLQLFTIGTELLNPDGSPQLDGKGQTIPTYDQTEIQNMARVFTGWTFPTIPGQTPHSHNPAYYIGSMIAVESDHDTDAKNVLGQMIPAGQTAEQDLDQVMGIVFNHPNVGPFVALRLIQHLVTSNPSPAYVQRISAVFANNGSGVRGDLAAVVSAILLDKEARAGDVVTKAIPTGGHLREPVLYAAAILRALGATVGTTNQIGEYINGLGLGQELLVPASVFNYYSPFSRTPGGAYAGPEFQLLSPSTAVLRANWVIATLLSKIGPGVSVDLTPFSELAPSDVALVDAVDMAFYGGQMPADVRSAITTAIDATSDPGTRAFDALFLGASANEFQVQQ